MKVSIEEVLMFLGELHVKLRLSEQTVEQLMAELKTKDAEIKALKKDK